MTAIKKIRIDKLASATVNVHLGMETSITENIDPEIGNVCIVRALEEKRVYDKLELSTGRMAKISKGDVIAGVLGERRALQGFAGVVPKRVKKGDVLHILNLGGVVGKAVSFSRDYGQPLKVEVIGMAVKDGKVLNIRDSSKKTAAHIEKSVPIIVVSGASMNSGKTQAISKIIQELTWKGTGVCAAKVSGISALKDILNMRDHGAVDALSFLDFGYPSTVNVSEVPAIAKGAINELLIHDPDVIALELGDGLLGDYGVMEFYRDKELQNNITCSIVCATDPVGAWGMKEIMMENEIPVHLVSGPVTDNIVGVEFVREKLKLTGINAMYQQKELGDFVIDMIETG
jgi:hypothetical protein